MATEDLRGCPLCGTKVTEAALGLRDYRWLRLPGKVGPMDLDFLLERNGDFLAMEFKPNGVRPGQGQQITFDALGKKGFQVWTVEGDGPEVKVWWTETVSDTMLVTELAEKVNDWFALRPRPWGKETERSLLNAQGSHVQKEKTHSQPTHP